MTDMARRLESEGLVERRSDPTDARASLIFPTARSRRFGVGRAAATLGELDQLVRGRLSAGRVAELKSALRELSDLVNPRQPGPQLRWSRLTGRGGSAQPPDTHPSSAGRLRGWDGLPSEPRPQPE